MELPGHPFTESVDRGSHPQELGERHLDLGEALDHGSAEVELDISIALRSFGSQSGVQLDVIIRKRHGCPSGMWQL